MAFGPINPLVGVELNATAARVVRESAQGIPQLTNLDGGYTDLPMVITPSGRSRWDIGRAAQGLRRTSPYLVCLDFLAALGQTRVWQLGRRVLEPSQALNLVFEKLRTACPLSPTVGLSVPAYLEPPQIQLLLQVAARARFPVGSWVSSPVAAAVAAYNDQPWSGPAVFLDVDEHALTCSVVAVREGQASLLASNSYPTLGLRIWYGRVVDGLADICVRRCRRDPRETASADQDLYEQVPDVWDACRRGQVADVTVRMHGWGQNLLLQASEVTALCAGLLRSSRQAMAKACEIAGTREGHPVILVTDAAGRLPGLVAVAQELGADAGVELPPPDLGDDFGEALLGVGSGGREPVSVLEADAPARGAWHLARESRGRRLTGMAPLPETRGSGPGPARLHYGGRDFVVRAQPFLVGGNARCDLVVDTTVFPSVAGTHCEIVFQDKAYVLRDHSRCGTLVNDRPVIHEAILQSGDRIRLGPEGPVLRFLGRAPDPFPLMTSA